MLSQAHGDDELVLLRELMRMDRNADRDLPRRLWSWPLPGCRTRANTDRAGLSVAAICASRSKRANRPLWAEITVALAEKDHAQVGQLLEQYDASLSRYDRINAAALTGDGRLAQSAAFETQHDQPDDDSLHLALTEQLLAFSDHAGLQLHSRRLDGIDERARRLSWHLALSPRWALDIDADHTPQRERSRLCTGAFVRTWPGPASDAQNSGFQQRVHAGPAPGMNSYVPMQFSHPDPWTAA
jgi:hypothetical protein